jgi:hypothetical protein
MLIHIPVGIIKPPQQMRRLHKMLIHLSLIPRKLTTQLINLLLRPALSQRGSLARTAKHKPDDNANHQRDNRRHNQVCHTKIVLSLPASEPFLIQGV